MDVNLAQRVLRRFLVAQEGAQPNKPSTTAHNVAKRFLQAMEFTTPEAMKEYLHEHPGADPKNHWVAEKEEEKAPSSGAVPKSKPMAKPAEQARVGVAGAEVPPPPAKLPRLSGLHEDEKKYEERMNGAFEEDPDGAAKAFLEAAEKNNWVFETDAAKNLLPEWSRPDLGPDGKPPVHPERAEFRGKYNAVLHQAANAIAKRAFISRLDEIAKMPEDKRRILVTSGGVAAGKGSALAAQPDLAKSVAATWDAAGEQNATENEWLLEECKKRGIRPTFIFVHADPEQSWPGVVERAKGIGRMVDAQLFADSYAVGARNFAAFHEKHKDEGDFVFGVFQGRGKPAKIVDSMPEEALKLDADDIYQKASTYIDEKKDDLPSYIYDGATIGRRAFRGESEKNANVASSVSVALRYIKGREVMANNPKTPPADKKELERIRKLFEQGLTDAAKDPKKMQELRIKQDQLVKPWENYVKGWKKPKDSDSKHEKKDKND